jgi:hypothetical protein
VARKAYVCVEAGASNGFSVAVAMLAKSVDTGTGVNAQGAVSPIIISNAVLYTGMLTNCDAAAITALGIVAFGQYSVMK